MDEEALIRRRESWQTKYNKRRALVLFLEIIASLYWIVYGFLLLNMLDPLIWFFYYIIFILLFIPGLVYTLYDFAKTRSMSLRDRMKNIDAETENPEFTQTITKSIQSLFCFLAVLLIPVFILLDFVDAYRLSSFFIAVFTLAIATLVGACWKMNTSWTKELEELNPPERPEDEYVQ